MNKETNDLLKQYNLTDYYNNLFQSQSSSIYSNKDIFFPEGTAYEKELNSNFKYFNIFWYNPHKTNDCLNFKKCFENVCFYVDSDLYAIINFFKRKYISEWIIITPGSKSEELISNLKNIQCVKSFFLYRNNTKFHEHLAYEIKKIGCVTSDPQILCQKLIEINKNYIIPNFNYQQSIDNYIISDKNDLHFKKKIEFKSEVIKSLIKIKNKENNYYNNLCIKLINHTDGDEIEKDFMKSAEVEDASSSVIIYAIALQKFRKGVFNNDIKHFKHLALLSLYFNKYPYFFNLLTFKEIELLSKTKNAFDMIEEKKKIFLDSLEKLYNKIIKNESILDETYALKEIQIYSIFYTMIDFNFYSNSSPFNYYQIINYFKDFDF